MISLLSGLLVVWAGAGIGLLAALVQMHNAAASHGGRRVIAVIAAAVSLYLALGYVALALNLPANEESFRTVYLRPAVVSLLAVVAALGLIERRR